MGCLGPLAWWGWTRATREDQIGDGTATDYFGYCRPAIKSAKSDCEKNIFDFQGFAPGDL
jgi:hypothetical protein